MKRITFQDQSYNDIQVSIASDGDFRVYFCKDEDSRCIKLNVFQANILINALKDLIEGK